MARRSVLPPSAYRASKDVPLFSRIWRAELHVFHELDDDLTMSLSAAQAWVDLICGHPDIISKYGQLKLTVRDKQTRKDGVAVAYHDTNTIAVRSTWRTFQVILHEISHHLTWALHGFVAGEEHGRDFTNTFVDLVSTVLGEHTGQHLRQMFQHFYVEVD